MKNLGTAFALAFMSLPLAAQTEIPDTPEAKILTRNFNRMMEWFPGEYDNQEQVYFNDNLGVPEELRHGRVHHIFAPVNLAGFPGTTFYVQQYQNGDPSDIYRQRVYSFTPDYDRGAIRLTIYIPKNPENLVDAHLDPSKWEWVSLDDFTTYDGCDVFWTYENSHYAGSMDEGACRIESQRSGKTIIVDDELQLSEDAIWIKDTAVDTDGNYVYGHKGGVPHKNNKAAIFNCWVAPQKPDGTYGFHNNVLIHDQGGAVWVSGDNHDTVGLRIRNVVWPTGNNRPSLVLYAHNADDTNWERAESYAWTSPDEPRIGINLRWVQASCTRGDDTITPGINLKTGSGN